MSPPCIHVDCENVLISVTAILFSAMGGAAAAENHYRLAAILFIAAVLCAVVLSRTILHEDSTTPTPPPPIYTIFGIMLVGIMLIACMSGIITLFPPSVPEVFSEVFSKETPRAYQCPKNTAVDYGTHRVIFVVVDTWGNPLDDLLIACSPLHCSHEIQYAVTQFDMSTACYGVCRFSLVGKEQYHITVYNTTMDVQKDFKLYPTNSCYLIILQKGDE